MKEEENEERKKNKDKTSDLSFLQKLAQFCRKKKDFCPLFCKLDSTGCLLLSDKSKRLGINAECHCMKAEIGILPQ